MVVLLFIVYLEERKCVEKAWMDRNRHIYTFPFLHASNVENPTYYSHQNKGFINYVFCRNRAKRNPAVTRLDSLACTCSFKRPGVSRTINFSMV